MSPPRCNRQGFDQFRMSTIHEKAPVFLRVLGPLHSGLACGHSSSTVQMRLNGMTRLSTCTGGQIQMLVTSPQ